MVVGYVLLAVTLVFLGIASFTDLARKEVADEVSIGFLISALAIRLAYSVLAKKPEFFLQAFFVGFVFLLLSLAMYYLKQWGGGDLLILTGLGVAFGTLPSEFSDKSFLPFPMVLIINLLIVGSVYGLAWILLQLVRRPSILRRTLHYAMDKRYLLILVSVVSFFSYEYLEFPGNLLGVAFFLLYLLFLISKSVESEIFVKRTDPSDLRIEDWITEDVTANGRVIVPSSTPGLTKGDIEAIRKAESRGTLDNKRILVKEGIPFVPVFPLALLLSVFVGEPISMLLFLRPF